MDSLHVGLRIVGQRTPAYEYMKKHKTSITVSVSVSSPTNGCVTCTGWVRRSRTCVEFTDFDFPLSCPTGC